MYRPSRAQVPPGETRGKPLNRACLQRALKEALHDLADQLEEFPTLLEDCGVDKFVVDQRITEIERLKRELRTTRRV